jgi:hypothetical protein
MRYKTNFIGKQYGDYLVVSSAGVNRHHQQLVKVRFSSGEHKTIRASNLYRIKERNESPRNLQKVS